MDLHAIIHEEDGSYWAEVKELPGCFASGHTYDELMQGLYEAIEMCLPAEKTVAQKARNGSQRRARVNEMKLTTV